MKFICFLLSSLILFSCATNTENTSENTTSENQALVYISNKSGDFDIYRNNLDGSSEVNLSASIGWQWYPQFRKTDDLIYFNHQDTSGNFSIKSMDSNGIISEFEESRIPGFEIATNSNIIAYTRKIDEATNIILSKLDNIQDSNLITNNQYYNGRPKINPAGNKIAFISDRTGSNEIYIFDIRSNKTAQITNNNKREKYMSWSPDGSQLAFTASTDSTENDIFIYNIDNEKTMQLTDTPINESEIAWSPLNDFIAYHAKVDGADDIFIIELSSNKISKITDSKGYYGEPCWILTKM